MPPHPLFRQFERQADLAHLVFEQHAQRLNQLQAHLLRQTAYIVVRLDARCCRRCIVTGALDHVGIERPLRQEANRTALLIQPCRFFLEDANKLLADDLALPLGIDYPCQPRQEALSRVHNHQWDMQRTAERLHNLLSLACSQAPRIHKDTGKLFANGAVDQQRRPDALAYLLDRLLDH